MERINFKQMPIESSRKELSSLLVDELADDLVRTYHNPDYRLWYCRLIYQFGIPTIKEWMGRAKDAKSPGKLFSKLASDAQKRQLP